MKLNGEMSTCGEQSITRARFSRATSRRRETSRGAKIMKKRDEAARRAEAIATDGLRSYRAAMTELGNARSRRSGRWANKRCENSHLSFRRRERRSRFRRMKTLQKFASVHAKVHNHFNLEHHLVDRKIYKERRSAVLG